MSDQHPLEVVRDAMRARYPDGFNVPADAMFAIQVVLSDVGKLGAQAQAERNREAAAALYYTADAILATLRQLGLPTPFNRAEELFERCAEIQAMTDEEASALQQELLGEITPDGSDPA